MVGIGNRSDEFILLTLFHRVVTSTSCGQLRHWGSVYPLGGLRQSKMVPGTLSVWLD